MYFVVALRGELKNMSSHNYKEIRMRKREILILSAITFSIGIVLGFLISPNEKWNGPVMVFQS